MIKSYMLMHKMLHMNRGFQCSYVRKPPSHQQKAKLADIQFLIKTHYQKTHWFDLPKVHFSFFLFLLDAHNLTLTFFVSPSASLYCCRGCYLML